MNGYSFEFSFNYIDAICQQEFCEGHRKTIWGIFQNRLPQRKDE